MPKSSRRRSEPLRAENDPSGQCLRYCDMRTISVTELNKYVKAMIAEDGLLSDVSVSGELSNVSCSGQGHYYFTLKEDNSILRCVLFRGAASGLRFVPKDGIKVIAHGKCSLYEPSGSFQLVCDALIEDGTGRLYEQFEMLKKKLFAEGLFNEDHKKKIPFLPKKVGAITSPGGAVIEDIKNVAGRRFPGMPIKLYPCPVQGSDAPPLIISALKAAISDNDCDVLIIARGGGSFEDLFCFNDETLARLIYDCPIPVISAVGHETDFTIADFVADRRAPTPSAAAELAVPEKAKLISDLASMKLRMKKNAEQEVGNVRRALDLLKLRPVFTRPLDSVETRAQMLDACVMRLNATVGNTAALRRSELGFLKDRFNASDVKSVLASKRVGFAGTAARLENASAMFLHTKKSEAELLKGKLEALGPANVLSRGYSMIEKNGVPVTSAGSISKGETFKVIMGDGGFDAERK